MSSPFINCTVASQKLWTVAAVTGCEPVDVLNWN